MIGRIATAAVALAVSTQAVQAQVAHQHGQMQDTTRMMGMMGQGMMGMGMMGGMGDMEMMMAGVPSPAMILGAAESLDLTAAQKTRLEALQKQLVESVQPDMQKAMAAQHQAMQALQGDKPDINAYESALKDAMNQIVLARVAAAKANLAARDVLTAEQRSMLSSASSMMHGMMGGMMHGMQGGMVHGMQGTMMGQHRAMHGTGGATGR